MLDRSSLLAACVFLILAMPLIAFGSATLEVEPRLVVCSSSASVTITGTVAGEGPPPVTPVKNPAAAYCVNEGYTHEIRTNPATGAKTGYCVFPDLSECEEWAFFRGTCSYSPSSEVVLLPVPFEALSDPVGGDGGADDGDGADDGTDEGGDALTPAEAAAAAAIEKIKAEMEPLLAKEAEGTLTADEAAALEKKKQELLEAEISLLEAKIATVEAERALLNVEDQAFALEEEALALTLEAKEIEKRALLAESQEGDAARLAEIATLLLIIDLKFEGLEIEERALSGNSWPEDGSRQEELIAAIAYLEAGSETVSNSES